MRYMSFSIFLLIALTCLVVCSGCTDNRKYLDQLQDANFTELNDSDASLEKKRLVCEKQKMFKDIKNIKFD